MLDKKPIVTIPQEVCPFYVEIPVALLVSKLCLKRPISKFLISSAKAKKISLNSRIINESGIASWVWPQRNKSRSLNYLNSNIFKSKCTIKTEKTCLTFKLTAKKPSEFCIFIITTNISTWLPKKMPTWDIHFIAQIEIVFTRASHTIVTHGNARSVKTFMEQLLFFDVECMVEQREAINEPICVVA